MRPAGTGVIFPGMMPRSWLVPAAAGGTLARMPRVTPPLPALCAVLWLGTAMGRAAETAAPLTAVWQKVATYLSKEALSALDHLPPAPDAAAARERELCLAVVELDQQPLTEGRLDRVAARLAALRQARSDDAVARAALYLLGRIAQLYRTEPDIGYAARCYRELVADPAAGHWGGRARVKLAVLELYALPASSPAQRLAAVDALIAGAAGDDDVTRRDLHRIAARGVLFYNLPPGDALAHLLAADRIGGLTGTPAADQLVQIGELAWDVGDVALSRRFYERLQTEYPRDPRYYLMAERMAGRPVPHRWEEFHGR